MTQLQTALILAGVGVVLVVYLYNWWQSVRRRREIERAVAEHIGRNREEAPDPLEAPVAAAPAPATAAAGRAAAAKPRDTAGARIEPVFTGEPPEAAPVGLEEEPQRGARAVRVVETEAPFAEPATWDAPVAPVAPSPVTSIQAAAPRVELPRADPPSAEPPARLRPRPASTGLALRPDPPEVDTRVDFLVRLLPMEPVAAETLTEILATAPDVGRHTMVLGCPVGSQEWQPVLHQSKRYEELALALQQIDRGGLVDRASLERFARWVEQVAERLQAGFAPPDVGQSHEAASGLDAFCAEADVLIGINVVTPDVPVPATKIRALVEAAGFRLHALGHYLLEDDDGALLLTLSDIEGVPFNAERIRTAAMNGVTLLLDIPRTPKPTRVFQQMMQVARQVAQGIGGRVVDDRRQPLNDAGVRVIAERIAALENRLTEQRMAPGSALARRIFA
jgi:hypothetical protein